MTRIQISDKTINTIFKKAKEEMKKLHGRGAFYSLHELRGVIDGEVEEFHEAVRCPKYNTNVEYELMQIVTLALFGLACIQEDTIE